MWNYQTLLLVGMQNFTATLENSLVDSFKVIHTLTIFPTNMIARTSPQRSENPCPHKKLYVNVDTGFILNYQHLKINPESPATGECISQL